MGKIMMGPTIILGTQPILLGGANVDDKPNFIAVGSCNVANHEPPMISVAIGHNRYTLKGIRQNMTFSVNVPSSDLVKETDYCGITSGSKANKAGICKFTVFYGKLGNAPLIKQCPINLECRVVHILDLGSHALVIGRIEEAHVSEDCLTDGKPDVDKVKPMSFVMFPVTRYQTRGEVLAEAFSIGKQLKPRP